MLRTLLFSVFAAAALAQQPTELWLRGYSVIPSPRSVRLAPGEVELNSSWKIETAGVEGRDIAARTLASDLESFHGLMLKGAGAQPGGVIRLAVRPGAVATGAEAGIDRQAYRLRIDGGSIEVVGNAAPGLFYGVQTLLQLARSDTAGRLRLPKGTIEDWPRLELRFLHWDTKHHQDRMETLKRYLDWSARFKVNMIGFELEDKFAYSSHPVIGAPGAFSPAELQEIVNYGLERHIQVVPQVQSPAHMAYILKHPEFAELRADGNNYQSDLCNPKTYDLLFSMYDDAIRATRGVDYFFVSTDEVYYAGMGKGCAAAYNPVNRSLAWVNFVQKAHEFLAKRGRRMLVWAEFPLLTEHVKLLPEGIIDGIVGEGSFLGQERERKIRQLQYTSIQGAELLFPNLFTVDERNKGSLETARASFTDGRAMAGEPIGAYGAAWDDSGLHNETFWLGWAAVAQYAWNPGAAPLDQHVAEFMNLYYGSRATGMPDAYRLLQSQARAWERAWNYVPSKTVLTRYGGYFGKGLSTHRSDMTLEAPLVNDMPDWYPDPLWADRYRGFIAEARARHAESARLQEAIQTNLRLAERNTYNLEVLLALARFIDHHWQLFLDLEQTENTLKDAQRIALENKPGEAVARLKAAHDLVEKICRERKESFDYLKSVFEKSRYEKGRSVNGREFVHVYDDVKDHWADRRADLSYMVAPEESIGLEKWNAELAETIRTYARLNGVELKE